MLASSARFSPSCKKNCFKKVQRPSSFPLSYAETCVACCVLPLWLCFFFFVSVRIRMITRDFGKVDRILDGRNFSYFINWSEVIGAVRSGSAITTVQISRYVFICGISNRWKKKIKIKKIYMSLPVLRLVIELMWINVFVPLSPSNSFLCSFPVSVR